MPPFDLLPALKHAARVADETCHITGDTSLQVSLHSTSIHIFQHVNAACLDQLSWYGRRASLAAIYGAAGTASSYPLFKPSLIT